MEEWREKGERKHRFGFSPGKFVTEHKLESSQMRNRLREFLIVSLRKKKLRYGGNYEK